MRRRAFGVVSALTLSLLAPPLTAANAGEAHVLLAFAERTGATWKITATIEHGDTGPEHYCDKWEVVAPDGTVLATRILQHPHVDEQPFTRSVVGVDIPAHVKTLTIRAHDTVHGWGGSDLEVPVNR